MLDQVNTYRLIRRCNRFRFMLPGTHRATMVDVLTISSPVLPGI